MSPDLHWGPPDLHLGTRTSTWGPSDLHLGLPNLHWGHPDLHLGPPASTWVPLPSFLNPVLSEGPQRPVSFRMLGCEACLLGLRGSR